MVAAGDSTCDSAQGRERGGSSGDRFGSPRNAGDLRRRTPRTRSRDCAADGAAWNCEQLWVVCGDDDDAPGDYGSGVERWGELVGLRVRVQTGATRAAAAVGRAASAAARLADVVC